jgi:hypothetical protein
MPYLEAIMQRLAVLVVCFLLFSASFARADFYRWVDKDGQEFFTNDQKQIPQEYRERATIVKPDESRVSVSEKPLAPGRASVTLKEHKDKYGRGEEYWRKKAVNLRMKLRNQQDEYDLVLKQMDDQDQKPKKTAGKKKKSRSGLEKKKMKLEKEIAQTRRMLDVDLPEEARRADAYPGWLRE